MALEIQVLLLGMVSSILLMGLCKQGATNYSDATTQDVFINNDV